jgi:hypothetical protein
MTVTDRPPYHQLAPTTKSVRFDDHAIVIELADGGELTVPLAWFPALAKLSPETLSKYDLVADNTVIHWGAPVDEWLSVANLLGQPDD